MKTIESQGGCGARIPNMVSVEMTQHLLCMDYQKVPPTIQVDESLHPTKAIRMLLQGRPSKRVILICQKWTHRTHPKVPPKSLHERACHIKGKPEKRESVVLVWALYGVRTSGMDRYNFAYLYLMIFSTIQIQKIDRISFNTVTTAESDLRGKNLVR